jgi:enoyl-CoA hydratase
MTYQFVDFAVRENIAWVYINRPEQRNALNFATLCELIDVFRTIDDDDTVRVAVLSGHGKVFVGGADLKEMAHLSALEYMKFGGYYNTLNKSIRENSKPVIGMINGHALGGGNILALSADIIVASDKVKFALPEINLGIFGGGFIMPSIVGRYRAAELVFLGEAYTAQQAFEMGIVNRVVPSEELLPTVEAMTKAICAKSPLAIKMAKKALIAGMLYNINTASEMQLPLMSLLYSGHDQKEGMNAFFEKRDPVYTGK